MPGATSWGLYGWSAGAIYAGKIDPGKRSLQGLWRISPTGGTPQQLTSLGTWLAIGAGAAWSVVQSPDGTASVLKRLDLNAGEISTWFTSPGGYFRVATVSPSGIVALFALSGFNNGQMWLVTAPGAAISYRSAAFWDAMTDSHGVWYVAGWWDLSIRLATDSHGRRMTGVSNVNFAGPCQ
jgi:hypothetical protein